MQGGNSAGESQKLRVESVRRQGRVVGLVSPMYGIRTLSGSNGMPRSAAPTSRLAVSTLATTPSP